MLTDNDVVGTVYSYLLEIRYEINQKLTTTQTGSLYFRINSMKLIMFVTFCLLITSCGSGSSDSTSTQSENTSCSVNELEATMDELLTLAISEVDFSFTVKRDDGRQYIFNRGSSTLQTVYESASTSKLVSAVIILRLVELGYLNLTDRPQNYINSWPINSADPLYDMNLAQLLSFTSGLETTPLCLNSSSLNFENCVNNIATRNVNNDITPGQSFYYAGTHLQVAGFMAYKAIGVTSWKEVFSQFKVQTDLFLNSIFDLPSTNNPRLAGGMHWSGEEYMDFLFALKNGEILNPSSMALLLTNYTTDITMTYSPVFDDLKEDWNYGFGLWHECESQIFNCKTGGRVSSPGAYGAYPYWDQSLDYIGLVARQGTLGTYTNGMMIERTVRGTVERWATCK